MADFSLSKILHILFSALICHFQVLFLDLDCVKDAKLCKVTKDELLAVRKFPGSAPKYSTKSHFNIYYLFPTLSALYTNLDSLYILYRNGFKYSYTSMPNLFTHLIFPYEFWQYGDVIIGLAISMSLVVFGCLLFDPKLDEKFIMYLFVEPKGGAVPVLIQNGTPLPPKEAIKIYQYRKYMTSFMPIMMGVMTVQLEAFYVWNFLQKWTGCAHDYVMFGCVVLFFFYGNISNLFMLYYFSLATRYLRIKQQCKLVAIEQLGWLISGKNVKFHQTRIYWARFKALNAQIAVIYEEILAQNCFWSRYLTIYFTVYIIEIVYLFYAYFFVQSTLGLQKNIFLFFCIEFLVILLYVTYECSRLVYLNGRMHQKSCQMALQLGRIGAQLGAGDRLKCDAMAANGRNIRDIAFKLTNDYRINSSMFQMLFTYISVLFMMIFRK